MSACTLWNRCEPPDIRDGRVARVPAVVLSTQFTRLTGCRAPVQQSPMGAVSTPDLAVAVAEAGGLGSVTVMGMPPA